MKLPYLPRRPIRSYVRRGGRITPAQRRALLELWPRYGVEPDDARLGFDALFGRSAPVILEIGFGNGDVLAEMAATHPENNFLGVEVHRPGVGGLLRKLANAELTNVRVMMLDVKDVLASCIPDASLAAVHLFFPDPWPKKRHHKRRLVQTGFVELVRSKLQRGGYMHVSTDWRDYADHMLAVFSQVEGIENAAGAGCFSERPASRPLTKFEQRGRERGHRAWDLIFRRIG